jgi:ArsR family transcriptional regulator
MKSTKDLQQAVAWFHALSDETRLQILDCLAEGEQCVCELTEKLEAAQSRLSFHLKTLKDAGIIGDRKEGRWVYYSLNTEVLKDLQDVVGDMLAQSRSGQSSSRRCE